MDGVSPSNRPGGDISVWAFEQVQAWAHRSDHHGQELECLRVVTVSHAQDEHLDPDDRKRWAKLSLQVNARMNGNDPWQQTRAATNDFGLRTLIIDRLGPDTRDPDWDPDRVAAEILGSLTMTPSYARELSDRRQTLSIEQMGELRRIKNITAPLKQLLRHLQLGPVCDQAREWVATRGLLP
jgi:hypothetical protein